SGPGCASAPYGAADAASTQKAYAPPYGGPTHRPPSFLVFPAIPPAYRCLPKMITGYARYNKPRPEAAFGRCADHGCWLSQAISPTGLNGPPSTTLHQHGARRLGIGQLDALGLGRALGPADSGDVVAFRRL